MPDDASAPNPPPAFPSSLLGGELPLTTIESFIAALVEAGPEVAEHMVRAAQELLLAAQALVSAAERNLAEQRRLREQAEAEADSETAAAAAPDADARDVPASEGPTLRSVDEVA
jgi:hypothetical protein